MTIKNIDPNIIVSLEQINSLDQNKPHTFIVEVRSYEKRTSRKGSEFMIVKLELIDGVIDLMIWQNKIDGVDKWLHSNMAKIKGKINSRNGDPSIWYDDGEVFSLDQEILPNENIVRNLNKPSPIMNIEEYTEGIKKEKTIIEEIGNENMDEIKEVIITVDDDQHSNNKHLMDI